MSKFVEAMKEARLWVVLVASILVSLGGGTAINANVAEHEAEESEQRAGMAVSTVLKKLNAHSKALADMTEHQVEIENENDELREAIAEMQAEIDKHHRRRSARAHLIIEEEDDPLYPPAPHEAAEEAFAEMPADYEQLQIQIQEKK